MDRDNEGSLLFSLDLNKAVDRVEHSFLELAMREFGFGSRTVKWIMLYSTIKQYTCALH